MPEVLYSEILAHKDDYLQWQYECPDHLELSTGYEDYEDDLKRYTSVDFITGNDETRDKIVNWVTDIYQEVGIFPIKYFSSMGAYAEALAVSSTPATFNGDTISVSGRGNALCSWLFPNLFKTESVVAGDSGPTSAYDKFMDRDWCSRMVRFNFQYNTPDGVTVTYPGINPISGLRMTGSVPTNFRPLNAKGIYEKFTPAGGTIYDFACGFGGRMLGALSSEKNFKYIGTDPNTETMYNLHRLGKVVDEVFDVDDKLELHCCGSEEYVGEPNSVDFAFSSPPYFNLEQYGTDGADFNNEEQCFNKYPTIESWLEGYVRGTVRSIRQVLKPGRYYAVNIADFNFGGGRINYVDDWVRISTEEGMPLYHTFYLGIKARTGSKLLGTGDSLKREPILLFKRG